MAHRSISAGKCFICTTPDLEKQEFVNSLSLTIPSSQCQKYTWVAYNFHGFLDHDIGVVMHGDSVR